jgi:hypothetical protein
MLLRMRLECWETLMVRSRVAPEQAELREAVANGANEGAASSDDALRRRENHEAGEGGGSHDIAAPVVRCLSPCGRGLG